MRRSLFSLAAVLALAGCDSTSDGARLNADYYAGEWAVVSVADEVQDQTDVLDRVLDDLSLSFHADRSFRLSADFADAGTDDFSTGGTYLAQPDIPALVLTVRGIAATLQASAQSSGPDRVRLTAPAAGVLFQGLPVQFEGDTSVVIERQ